MLEHGRDVAAEALCRQLKGTTSRDGLNNR